MLPRTLLFVPGHDEYRMSKALNLKPDAIVMDLEDAVARSMKAEARACVGARIATADSPSELWVRVNDLSSGLLEEDLRSVVGPTLSGIVLPMVETADTVLSVARELRRYEMERGWEVGRVGIMPIVETAAGLLSTESIVAATGRIRCAMFGSGDYAADMGIDLSPTQVEVRAVRETFPMRCWGAARVKSVDGGFPFLHDHEAFEVSTRIGKSVGYSGRVALTPTQLAIVRDVYRYSSEQVAWARRVSVAFANALGEGRSSVKTDSGEFVDYPIAARAEEILRAVGETNSVGGDDL